MRTGPPTSARASRSVSLFAPLDMYLSNSARFLANRAHRNRPNRSVAGPKVSLGRPGEKLSAVRVTTLVSLTSNLAPLASASSRTCLPTGVAKNLSGSFAMWKRPTRACDLPPPMP